MDANETSGEKAMTQECCEQYWTNPVAVRQPNTITKTIQVRRTRYPGHCWRSWDELISNILLCTPSHGRAKTGRPASTYIKQFGADTGWSLENLPRTMDHRDGCGGSVSDIMTMTMMAVCLRHPPCPSVSHTPTVALNPFENKVGELYFYKQVLYFFLYEYSSRIMIIRHHHCKWNLCTLIAKVAVSFFCPSRFIALQLRIGDNSFCHFFFNFTRWNLVN